MMSREHLLTRLAQQHLVIHSTPPQDRHHPAPSGGYRSIGEKLYHYTNPWYLPRVYKSTYANEWLSRTRSHHRRWLLRKIGESAPPILYLWHPIFSNEIGRYGEKLVVYHIYDDYLNLPGSAPDLEAREKHILRNADLVFVANEALLETRKKLVDREYIHLPHGVDVELFETARLRAGTGPSDLASVPHPRLGYMGRINAKVNLELVHHVACNRPAWSFVFVGPVDTDESDSSLLSKLRALPNVYILGARPYEEIASYWMQIDVAIIPYRHVEGQWAFFGSPLKLREAFAADKPVVISPLRDAQSYGDLLMTAKSGEDWLRCIEYALRSASDPDLSEKRRAYARGNSWIARTIEIRQYLSRAIMRKDGDC